MPWKEIRDADGKLIGTAIICGGRRPQRCQDCGREGTILCDYPVTRGGKQVTCDRRCCRPHSVSVGPDKDYCLPHARYAETLKGEPGKVEPK